MEPDIAGPRSLLLLAGWLLSASGCGAGPTGHSGPCPAGMVQIDAGDARLGVRSHRQPWQGSARTVALAAYCVDTYEYPNVAGATPKAFVTFDEAQAWCAAAGKRLCTGDEWERACRGPQGRLHPYGDVRDPTACNTPIEGTGPLPGRAAPVSVAGAFPRCVTPEGVFDLGGNLSEWVDEPWAGVPEPFAPRAKVDPETWRTLRGGTMWSQTFYGQDCTSAHGHPRSTLRSTDDGFRCCLTP